MTVTKGKLNINSGRGSGRPTKQQAALITQRIVDVATRLFSETSFEATSVDLIAATAGISKQTFYARFVSKEDLFSAVIRNGVNALLKPITSESGQTGSIETTLVRIGVELWKRALSPEGIALDRFISAEAHRMPQLAIVYYENAFVHARDLIAKVFATGMRDGQIRSANVSFIAEQFLHAVVVGPVRITTLSGRIPSSEKSIHDQITGSVRLILDGCRSCSA